MPTFLVISYDLVANWKVLKQFDVAMQVLLFVVLQYNLIFLGSSCFWPAPPIVSVNSSTDDLFLVCSRWVGCQAVGPVAFVYRTPQRYCSSSIKLWRRPGRHYDDAPRCPSSVAHSLLLVSKLVASAPPPRSDGWPTGPPAGCVAVGDLRQALVQLPSAENRDHSLWRGMTKSAI